MEPSDLPTITRSRLVHDLRQLGVRPGGVLMLHASVKAIGWIVGGPDVVLQALLDVLTPDGTLMMYVGWEEAIYEMAEWPEEKRRAYLEECPPFDPATSRAYRKWSILTEYLRTWPGAQRSQHPEASVAAVGAQAAWITADHPLQYGYGRGSPLEKLCQSNASGGQVLLLGAPLNTLTILHHAEHLANVPNKRIARYQMPILRDGQRVWADFEEFDTSLGIVDWEGEDYFITIAREFLASGQGNTGTVGAAQSHLFDAAALVRFGVEWMERNFGQSEASEAI
jgi:aminoglycoside 3-N-acetyltransferase